VESSLSWVKGISQAIADEVNRQGNDDNEKAWPPEKPWSG
jgi:hypothetical protein